MVGEDGDGEEHEGAHEPAGPLEGVGKAEHPCADDGDEDVGEGLGLGGEAAVAGFSQERGVSPGKGGTFRTCEDELASFSNTILFFL